MANESPFQDLGAWFDARPVSDLPDRMRREVDATAHTSTLTDAGDLPIADFSNDQAAYDYAHAYGRCVFDAWHACYICARWDH